MSEESILDIKYMKIRDIDFGFITEKYAEGMIKVSQEEFTAFNEARKAYTIEHDKLMAKLPVKVKNALKKWVNSSISEGAEIE